jgi:hypothetical protein
LLRSVAIALHAERVELSAVVNFIKPIGNITSFALVNRLIPIGVIMVYYIPEMPTGTKQVVISNPFLTHPLLLSNTDRVWRLESVIH